MGRVRWAALVLMVIACGERDPLEGASFSSVALGRSSAQVLYTASGVDLYRSDDGGGTWGLLARPWTNGDPDGATRIAVSPADTHVVLIGTSAGKVYRSEDGGTSWRLAQTFPDYVQRLAFHPTRADRAYGLALGELFISTDGGRSWASERELTAGSPACRLDDICTDFAFDAQDEDRVYAACSKGVEVSTSAGACWAPSRVSPSNTSVIVASPSESSRLWVAAADGVWASQDGGDSFVRLTDWGTVFGWPDVPTRPGSPALLTTITTAVYAGGASGPALLFGTSDVGVVSVRVDDGATTDVGASLIRRAGAIDQIAAAPSGVFLATESTCRGHGGVFFSANQGATWQEVLTSHPFPDLTQPIGDAIPHRLMIIFYRDVSLARQDQIMQEHRVTPEYPTLTGPLLYFVTTTPDDPRSVADLLQEFDSLDEIDCAMNDFALAAR